MRDSFVLAVFLFLLFYHIPFAAFAEEERRPFPVNRREATYLLETWLQSVIDFDRLPGISIAVVHDQEIVYTNGFGFADVDERIKATPGTLFKICSISKIFTGIALMQLRDTGHLSLDDPVSKYLSWFNPETISPESTQPTMRDLLRHSGGLPCEPDHTVWQESDQLYPSREDLVERASSIVMSYDTNTEFNYSNLGYALLGEVVSVVSGMGYGEYVQKNILQPLELDMTIPYPPEYTIAERKATGYGRWPREGSRVKIDWKDTRALRPAMGFASTVRDLAKFAMWQFRVLDGQDEGVLNQQTLKEMQASHWSNPDWGLGFSMWHMGDKVFVGHQGGCPGFKSQIIICPEEKMAVVAMINATDAPQFTIVFRAYEIMSQSLETNDGKRTVQWENYTGYYTADRSWSEAEVLEWSGSLAVMWIPTTDPIGSLIKLQHIEGNVFRQIKGDGKLGKYYVFGTDSQGIINSMKFNNNILVKSLRPL